MAKPVKGRSKQLLAARRAVADLGRRLAVIREFRGLSMPQVETLTDMTIERSALSRIESGKRPNPSVAALLTLCVAYDVDVKFNRNGTITVHGTNLGELAKTLAERETNGK